MSDPTIGDKARWFEVGVSITASIATTAVVVSWTISAMLAQTKEKVEEHEKLLSGMQTAIASQSNAIASLNAHQSDTDRRQNELLDQIRNIDVKIDTLLSRHH